MKKEISINHIERSALREHFTAIEQDILNDGNFSEKILFATQVELFIFTLLKSNPVPTWNLKMAWRTCEQFTDLLYIDIYKGKEVPLTTIKALDNIFCFLKPLYEEILKNEAQS